MIQDYELLKKAPPHHSVQFMDYLRKYNVVKYEDTGWLLIANYKYHTPDNQHYTLFAKRFIRDVNQLSKMELDAMKSIMSMFSDWFIYKNSSENQSVLRLHFHIVKDYTKWLKIMYDQLLVK